MVYFYKSTEGVSQTAKDKTIVLLLYFVLEWPLLAYIFAHWSNIACLPTGRINTYTNTPSGSWKWYLKLWEFQNNYLPLSTIVKQNCNQVKYL